MANGLKSVYVKNGQYKVGDIFLNRYIVVSVGVNVFKINKPVPCKEFPRSRTLDIGNYVSIKIKSQ
jgi:hypothetical protein